MNEDKTKNNIVKEIAIVRKYGKYTYGDYLSWINDKRYYLHVNSRGKPIL